LASEGIDQMTTAGVSTQYPVNDPNAGVWGITTGPDGNLWYAQQIDNEVGTMTTAGTVTQTISLPAAYASPWEGVTGSDGNLWFTENGANNLALITP
jgi:virginiamycin B lyase